MLLDTAEMLAALKLRENSPRGKECLALLNEGAALARPRFLWLSCRVEELAAAGLFSPLFQRYLQAGQQVWPYLATCGVELGEWCSSLRGNTLRQYWGEYLAEQALFAAVAQLEAELTPLAAGGYLAAFNPGALAAWPLSQQRQLFGLFGEQAQAIGVTLSENCLMQPQKTLSGLYFFASEPYYNCQLCPRARCEGRRDEYRGENGGLSRKKAIYQE